MTLAYGYVKTKVTSEPKLKPSHHGHETQYHLHCNLAVGGATWDAAVNVGTNDSDDCSSTSWHSISGIPSSRRWRRRMPAHTT